MGSHSHALEDQARIIGERLRALREEQKFSQGEVEKRTGLVPAYISRVENGHTVPAIETIEKFARALEVPRMIDVLWGDLHIVHQNKSPMSCDSFYRTFRTA